MKVNLLLNRLIFKYSNLFKGTMYFTWDYVIRGFVFQGLNIDTSASMYITKFM